MNETFSDGYVRPTTAQELRDVLLKLMQGKAWQELCSSGHPIKDLLPQAAESLRDVRDPETAALKGSPLMLTEPD